MAGPIRIYEYYTDAELTAELARLKQETATGSITAVGGAGKSSSMEKIPLKDRWLAYNLELRIRGGNPRPQKVTQVIRPRIYYDDCNQGYPCN